MTYPAIATIVEGQGETDAVQCLLARLLPWLDGTVYVHCHTPLRKPRDLLLKPHGMTSALQAAMGLRPRPQGILLMVDADDDCPIELAERLCALAKDIRSDMPVFTVIPNREFEAWFLTSAHSYAGMYGLPPDLQAPPNPEAIRDAKGWFSDRMSRLRPYKPSQHQKPFVKHLNLDAAHANSRSFRKLCSDLSKMIGSSPTS